MHPQEIKSKQGTLEYRFSKADIEAFKAQEAERTEQTRQDRTEETRETGHKEPVKRAEFLENKDFKGQTEETRQDTPEQTGHGRQDRAGQESGVLTLLRETTAFLKEQLVKKDEQIKDLGGKIDELIQRDRETNILIGQLQSKVLMLENPKEAEETGHEPEQTGQDKAGETGQDKPVKKSFIEKVKDFFKETK